VLRLLGCDGTSCEEATVLRPEELAIAREKWPVVWIDVEGLDDPQAARLIGSTFGIGELALEDAVTPDERPKVEAFGHQVLVAARTVRYEADAICTDAVCIFLGDRYVLTFRERLGRDPFEAVRQRIRQGRTRIGHEGADALCALLLDVLIDGYFPVLEQFGDRLEHLEDEALDHPSRELLVRIHDVRNDLMTLRRALWPTRDLLHSLGREPTPLVVSPETPWRSSSSSSPALPRALATSGRRPTLTLQRTAIEEASSVPAAGASIGGRVQGRHLSEY
jgi:magnesium transporter